MLEGGKNLKKQKFEVYYNINLDSLECKKDVTMFSTIISYATVLES